MQYPFRMELEDRNVVESDNARGELLVMAKEESRNILRERKRRFITCNLY